ncbi:YbaY family lipoprotein [Pseudomonas fakonensis]|uniref:YbaY family lipoprotein n=1 Tax=Pseudomonas fakonensis TaxID=2842355 RepID=A0ABX8N236_9PSED|nr:YbaY family lipoprotein [Pseudomonas fakonensis]QXH50408.1 YbaY family lipoprotein [Pseudomonas fakonensis]
MTQLKSFDVEIVSSGDNQLPASGEVQLSLLDVSMADAPAISHAELRLRCAGVLPITLQLTFDSSQIDPSRDYALGVSIEQDGRLQYINTYHHAIQPGTMTGTQRVTVDKVATGQ